MRQISFGCLLQARNVRLGEGNNLPKISQPVSCETISSLPWSCTYLISDGRFSSPQSIMRKHREVSSCSQVSRQSANSHPGWCKALAYSPTPWVSASCGQTNLATYTHTTVSWQPQSVVSGILHGILWSRAQILGQLGQSEAAAWLVS